MSDPLRPRPKRRQIGTDDTSTAGVGPPVGIATVLGLFVTAAAWSRAPSQGSPTATRAAPSSPAPGVTPTPTAGPEGRLRGTPARQHTPPLRRPKCQVPSLCRTAGFSRCRRGRRTGDLRCSTSRAVRRSPRPITRMVGMSLSADPVSRSFQLTDGAIYQLFAHGLLRWQPGTPAAEVTPVDLLAFVTLHGLDGQLWWLGVPRRAPPWDERPYADTRAEGAPRMADRTDHRRPLSRTGRRPTGRRAQTASRHPYRRGRPSTAGRSRGRSISAPISPSDLSAPS